MMQMNPTIPSSTQNFTNSYQIKPVNFHCSRGGSPLNPTSCSAQSVNGPTEKNRIHLNNLEKLLQKRSQQPTQQPDPIPVQQRGRAGILEGLDVTRFWPDMMTTIASATADHHDKNETASPNCHLNRLQQLLSKTPQYSPRNHISTRWREYHGCNDWAGLLDPLDENLRREVVRYGEFVQAAYHSFHSSPATSTADSSALNSRNNEVALPDRSYKVTKSLYATSSVGLPKWVDEVAPDLGWMTQRSSWIGYVAVCDDQREIARMGRRDIVIALRGTSTCLEWVENVRDVLVPMSPSASSSDNRLPSKVECGFLNLFKTKGEEYCSRDGARNHYIPSLAESVVQEIRRLMETYKGEALSITVTGHSLGAALALLVADEIISGAAAEPASTTPPPPVAVFSFGGPRVGNRAFADRLKSKNVKVLRIVNNQDVITRIPGIFISEELDRRFKNTRMDGILELLDKNLPWAYTHVGTELKVDTKMSPYLKPNADVACCHDLEAYLHLVDGYLAPNCPFRSNAKRSLLKLLTEQGSNVKKLYTSKAKSLTSLKIDRQQHVKDRHHATHQLSTCLPSPS